MGIPYTSFGVEDVAKEYERLEKLGVRFTLKPTKWTRSPWREFTKMYEGKIIH